MIKDYSITKDTKLCDVFSRSILCPLIGALVKYDSEVNKKPRYSYSEMLEARTTFTFQILSDFIEWYNRTHVGVWYENIRSIGAKRAEEINRAVACMNGEKYYPDVKLMSHQQLEEEVLLLRKYRDAYLRMHHA